jgi:anti-sigma B factor antagonist
MSVAAEGETAVVRVDGHLLVGNRKELQQLVLAAVEGGARHVVVDLAASGYVDSAGLGTLVMLAKRVRAVGGAFGLANVNEDVQTLFALTRLDAVFGTRTEVPATA